ncbi:MAG: twin-arginine translocase subunit TatB [Proteobacteria bacterium]|nr:twin-arginine translocase subunit TatB [Pseudomonadota bacterium]MBS0550560.1 twin-arginine translocase subunit TatB [Pseudomonadota bacterium]
MFGIDSPELLVIAVVALVVIGPKELPGLLRTWGKWMSQMRGMASEFRGHVDEMIRQSELDQVKKQLEDSAGGLDFKSLDPTKQIKDAIQEGMDEGQKALADAKGSLDNPLAEPESAPQIAAEPAATAAVEPPPAAPEALAAVVSPAGLPAPDAVPAVADSQAPHAPHDDKPKAAAAG